MKTQIAVIAWCLLWPLCSLMTYFYAEWAMPYVGLVGLVGLVIVGLLIMRMVEKNDNHA